ncbi:MAG TPA: aspartate kinase [Thermoanaerobaculia bacterium]|nr:aspartate kinase [Thermoanaerobaculia bacterium]
MTHVLKFGGTSVSSIESLTNVVDIIQSRARQTNVVVVVSALSGVTSALDAAAATGDPSIVPILRDRHASLLHDLTARDWNGSGSTIRTLLQFLDVHLRRTSARNTPEHDEIVGIGERLAAPLVAEVLRHRGVRAVAIDATEVVRTDATHGNARVDLPATRQRLRERLAGLGDAVPVVTGFVGATHDGIPTTLGRGGSDISAAIIGAALDADEVEIWSDVDGIYSADPRATHTARLYSRLTHDEALQIARDGAKVLHPETLPPLAERGIRLSIRNTFAPERRGTRIDAKKPTELVIAGATGNVGSALVRQLRALNSDVVRIRIVANSRVTNDARACGGFETDWASTLESIDPGSLFVDVTASAEVASLYEALLERGIGIVTANKLAGSGEGARWQRLRRIAARRRLPLRYETTVGAALPVLRTARELHATGDALLSLDAVLSGTLSYILARVSEGVTFFDAVLEAQEKGLTEPDPTIDLSGRDVAAKLVILLRELGVDISLADVEVTPLVTAERGKRLAYVASYHNGIARAAVRELEEHEPLARLRAGENIVIFRTTRYDAVPLTVAGPGAGPEVTAAGVLAEILEVG